MAFVSGPWSLVRRGPFVEKGRADTVSVERASVSGWKGAGRTMLSSSARRRGSGGVAPRMAMSGGGEEAASSQRNEMTREQALKELAELARVEEKYGRKGYLSEKDIARLRDEGVRQYNKQLLSLLGDTIFLGGLGAGAVAAFYPLPSVASYGLGVVGSMVYILLLSRSVDRLASNARQGRQGGDFLGPARFLVLVVIVLFIAKNQEKTGLQVIPATVGFLTYKLALFIPLISGEEVLDL